METSRLSSPDAPRARQIAALLEREQEGRSPEAWRSFLERPENILLEASDEGEPVGFLLGYLLDRIDGPRPMVCLYEIAVAEERRRRGIGRCLVEHLLKIATEENAVKVWGLTHRSNEAAVALFQATGAAVEPAGDDVLFTYRPGS